MICVEYYKILQTNEFEEELEEIYRYIALKLKEPSIARNFYKKVIKSINSLKYLPERNCQIGSFKNKSRNLRRILVNHYVIIYEIKNDTRTSIHFTYFSFQSKLF